MDGEYGNMEFWIDGHTWTNSTNLTEVCRLYDNPTPKTPEQNAPPAEIAQIYTNMTASLRALGYCECHWPPIQVAVENSIRTCVCRRRVGFALPAPA